MEQDSSKPAGRKSAQHPTDELTRLIRRQERDLQAQKRGKSDGLKKDQQVGRHDTKYVPSGYKYERGHLYKLMEFSQGDCDIDTELMARSVLETLIGRFYIRSSDGSRVQLSLTGSLFHQAHADKRLEELTPAIRQAYEAIIGRPYGEPDWIRGLVSQLESNAYYLEQERLREAHNHADPDLRSLLGEQAAAAWKQVEDKFAPVHNPEISGACLAPANGRQILAYLRREAERAAAATEKAIKRPLTQAEHSNIFPPDELTAQVVDEMIGTVGLGRGGRGGAKTARSAVDDWVGKITNRAKKKPKAARRKL